jgi:WXXGXW repeat (2 copies)
MQHIDRVLCVAAVALGAATLSGCHGLSPAAPTPAAIPLTQTSSLLPTTLDPVDSPEPLAGSTTQARIEPSGSGTTAGTVVAPYRPPPQRAEIPPPAPSPQALWRTGHWNWDGTRYVWARGHYIERPTPTANWLPGYWEESPDGWTWVEGRWT